MLLLVLNNYVHSCQPKAGNSVETYVIAPVYAVNKLLTKFKSGNRLSNSTKKLKALS